MAPSKEILDRAIQKVQELLAIDMGSLVEDKKERARRRVRGARRGVRREVGLRGGDVLCRGVSVA